MKIVLPCLKQAIFALEQGQRKVLGPTPAALNAQHNDVAFSSIRLTVSGKGSFD